MRRGGVCCGVLVLACALAFGSALPAAGQDLQVLKSDTPDPVLAGDTITYEIQVANFGDETSEFVSLEDTLPAGTTFQSFFAEDPSWDCSTPGLGATGTVSCSIDAFDPGFTTFFLTVTVDPGVTTGTVITNCAIAGSETVDPNEGNNEACTETTVDAPPPTTDVSVTKVDDPDPVAPGDNLVYTITVTNSGPADATSVGLADLLPPETTFVSLVQPPGWTCAEPTVGTNGTVSCSIPSLAPGSYVFTLTVAVGSDVVGGTEIANAATVSSAEDLDESNNVGSASTMVTGSADLSVAKVDDPDPVTAGTNLTYTITVESAGPDCAAPTVSDGLPAGTTFVSLESPPGWFCITPQVGFGGTVSCSIESFCEELAAFTLTVAVAAGVPGDTVLSNTATASSAATDPTPLNNSGTATTTVEGIPLPPAVTGTKTVSGSFTAGGAVTYTVMLTNGGTAEQPDNPGNEFTDVLPAELTLVNATATSGVAVPTGATNTVTWNGALAGGASVTITIDAIIEAGVVSGTSIANQGTIAFDADENGTNESSALTDDPTTAAEGDPTELVVGAQVSLLEIPTLDWRGLAALAALFAAVGAWWLRRAT